MIIIKNNYLYKEIMVIKIYKFKKKINIKLN